MQLPHTDSPSILPMKPLHLLGWLIMASICPAATIATPRCEYRTNPVGIEAAQPRLSWILKSEERGVVQTAWQVLAATDPALLEEGKADLWDSGKVSSGETIQIVYQGKSPGAGRTCYWKVRAWDQKGGASPWSDIAEWTAGLAKPGDWTAKWIYQNGGSAADASVSTEGLPWVWLPGAKPGDQAAGSAFFRKEVEIPEGRAITGARFLMAADNECRLFVNGQPAGGKHKMWDRFTTVTLSNLLSHGRNVLAVEARNAETGPAGLIGKLLVNFADGGSLEVPVDESWLSSATAAADWSKPDFAANGWQAAAVVGRSGDKPWGVPGVVRMDPASYFRKSFRAGKPVKRATLFASALGAYELRMNGRAIDRDVLSPGWTDFGKRVHYLGYDVTNHVKQGENVIGAVLGDGWYASYLAFTGKRRYYGGDPRFLAQLRIDYQDGASEIIGTDSSWLASQGPIRHADLLMGCEYDATREMPGWDAAGFAADAWKPAVADPAVKANLTAHPGEPIRRCGEIAAIKLTEPKPGMYVFDLGQNMVGFSRLMAKGRPGQAITLRHAEMLNPDGTIYTANLRAAAATDTFILTGGGKRAYEPSFTFHGFQYVEVTGLDYKPDLTDITGVVLHSDLKTVGSFECSEPLVNQLVKNSLWGQKGNFLDVPTDCPQRDERAGWTGDAQVFMKTACFNMDSAAFYTKWLRDLCTDSQRDDGGFGDVAPHLSIVGFGNTGWSDAGPVCAWRMFEMYGDKRVLEEHYPALVRHMDFLAKTSKDFTRGTGAFGDWLRLSGPQHSEVIGTAYYAYTAQTMAGIAAALGKQEDAAKYHALHDRIRGVFSNAFIKPDGRILDGKGETGQTFYALAFGLDLVPQELRAQVSARFAESIAKENGHIATGFLGTPFILFALQNAGHPELAYQLVLNKDYPGWLQQVLWGSTTMWERWDGWRPDKGFQDAGMNSFNHYWLGCVSEWLITQAAGIDTAGSAFQQIVIKPEIMKPGTGFDWVKSSYDSIRGTVSSAWKRSGDAIELEVTIPPNCKAVVHVPARSGADVTEGGKPAAEAEGVKFLRMENGRAVFEIGSGRYAFRSATGVSKD